MISVDKRQKIYTCYSPVDMKAFNLIILIILIYDVKKGYKILITI